MLFKRGYIQVLCFSKIRLKIVAAAAIVRVLYEVKYLSHKHYILHFMKIFILFLLKNTFIIFKFIYILHHSLSLYEYGIGSVSTFAFISVNNNVSTALKTFPGLPFPTCFP